ncbi:MAG: sugar isomerase [Candidatus Solibacter usitatus]|nr:sugar isomerase [Candidatus Solibacter usitatus]
MGESVTDEQRRRVLDALDRFEIEVPSWGFANTGTRFGKFLQDAAASTIEEKLSDAGQVHKHTGCCPSVAVHVLWDFPNGIADAQGVGEIAAGYGVRIGSINPNVFQDQIYKHGSLGNPDAAVRKAALDHMVDCVSISHATGSRDISLWFADGSNYPGSQHIRKRRRWFRNGLCDLHDSLRDGQRLLVEYKPFEPAFYHTDIADWGMALLLARAAGPMGRVLVDLGHHYQAQNIEQIVAWLLAENMLGGFHFNDRRFADDDLTLGSIDPYQLFRIFHEIRYWEWDNARNADIAYMIDKSHNLKGKIEAMIQSVSRAQELYAKAALVEHEKLSEYQEACDLVSAEECLQDAYATDVRGVIAEWRAGRGVPVKPLDAFRESGYVERAAKERGARNRAGASSYA